MAERVEEPEVEVEEALERASPAAIALALGRAGRGGKALDAKAEAFLDEQTAVLRLQKEHLHEQRQLQLAHLKVRRWKDRASLAGQALGVLIGLAIAVGLGTMVWQAHEDHGLVIEAFSTPPDIAARGLTGQVVASQLLDKLSDMQAKTDSARPARSYQNNWGDDLKVEIPETGVSLGELNRWLRQWLGSQTRVSGEVFRTASGLTVSVRTGADGGASFSAPEADLDGLMQRAAEAVYQRSQPYRYATWLIQENRSAEGVQAMEALADGPAGEDRIWAGGLVALLQLEGGDIAGGLARLADVQHADPDGPATAVRTVVATSDLDREEAELPAQERASRLIRAHPDAVSAASVKTLPLEGDESAAELRGDFRTALGVNRKIAQLRDTRAGVQDTLIDQLYDDAMIHDVAAADAALARLAAADPSPNLLMTRLRADIELGRWPPALQTAAAMQTAKVGPLYATVQLGLMTRRTGAALTAYAKAMSGDLVGAKALIATTPPDCDTCLRMRGRIAAIEHDWPSAERWFGMEARQAPSIPFAYVDWARVLLDKGDVDGAIAKLALAHEKGPHYADALELWGEALMRKGDYPGAAAKFAEAARDAPRWTLNQQLWRQALVKAHGHG